MRDFHVYDHQGNRYLDLYLNNGQALMGHKPGRISLVLKNMSGKGLFASYPSIHEDRLIKALHLLLPDCTDFRVYRNGERLLSILSKLMEEEAISPSDPLFSSPVGTKISYWRPFLPDTIGSPIVIPIFPVGGDFFPGVVGFSGTIGEKVPPSDVVAPILLAMLTRAVYDLFSYREKYNEEIWKKFPLPYWSRKGPYLLYSGERASYSEVFKNCKEQGILIAPAAGEPGIIPGEWTDGEIHFLRRM